MKVRNLTGSVQFVPNFRAFCPSEVREVSAKEAETLLSNANFAEVPEGSGAETGNDGESASRSGKKEKAKKNPA